MMAVAEGRRPRGILPRRDRRICWTILSSAHQRFEASMSRGKEDMERTGGGVGARSGRLGSTKTIGSRICPIKPLARMSAWTPSSQGKKSCFEVKTGICVTVGRVLERVGREGEGEETGTG